MAGIIRKNRTKETEKVCYDKVTYIGTEDDFRKDMIILKYYASVKMLERLLDSKEISLADRIGLGIFKIFFDDEMVKNYVQENPIELEEQINKAYEDSIEISLAYDIEPLYIRVL